jgi:uncharacterized protein (DUF58 family)
MHIHRTFWVVLLLAVAMLAVYQYIRDMVFLRAAAVALIMVIIGLIWTLLSLRMIDVLRSTLEYRQQAGKVFNEQFVVRNGSRWPVLWLEIIDESDLGISHGSKFITWLKGKTRWSYATHTLLFKRGFYHLGPTRIISGDPFGLFHMEKVVFGGEQIMVLPYFETISNFAISSGYLPGGKALRTRSLEVTPYAISLRDYQPGDPLRRIDWKSSARLDKLMVKEFEQDPETYVWIILDGSKESNEASSGKKMTTYEQEVGKSILFPADRTQYRLPEEPFEYVVSLAATLCDYYIKGGKSIGLISSGQALVKLSPDLGVRQQDKIFEALAIILPEDSMTISELLESQISSIPKGSTLVILSASVDYDLSNELKALKNRNYSPIFVGVNPASFGGEKYKDALIEDLSNSGIPARNFDYGDPLTMLEGLG